jgi:phosphotriesterase-related protein
MGEISRREFIGTAAVLFASQRPKPTVHDIETVTGQVAAGRLGVTLMHEHVLVDFIGADQIERGRYDREEVCIVALPYLRNLSALGCRTLVECTPAYLGRDPLLLRQLSETSGMQVITNTGYYAANGGKHVPAHAHRCSAAELARLWVDESVRGIERTGIKPGLIKIGVERAPLPEISRKLTRAAAITHRETGLSIASHTPGGSAALEQLAILGEEGVSPAAFVWVHAQSESNPEIQIQVAGRGAWMEFDGIDSSTLEQHAALVRLMIERGHIGRTLISMDAGWYHVGEPGGGKYRGYEVLFTEFLPLLRTGGVTDEQIRILLEENPRHALEPAQRPL